MPPTGCAGRCGDADTKHAPGPATTDDRAPGNHEDHDLRLEVCHERGRGLDVGRARGSGAVQKMKDWPFGAALWGEASNHHMLRWLKTVVVSDEERRTGGVRRVPADWPGGDRRRGGASSVQALARNVGTPRPGSAGRVLDRPAEGSTPSSGNCKGPSTGAGQGGGPARGSGDAW